MSDELERDRLLEVMGRFFDGDLDKKLYEPDPVAFRFISMLERYAAPGGMRSGETPFRWHGLPVVSTLVPPIGSDLEKRFLVNKFLSRFRPDPLAQFTIIIAPSYRCRCHCEQCYVAEYADPGRTELAVDQWRHVFEKVIDAGVWHIDISGGEPFENPKFFDTIGQVPMDKATTIVATNGYCLDERTIDRVKQSNIMAFKVSLESSGKMQQNTGDDQAFDRTVGAIKRLLDNKLYTFVQAFVERGCWRDNELEERILLCRDIGITRVHVISPLALGRMRKREDSFLAEKDREYIYRLREEYAHHREGAIGLSVFPDDGVARKGCPASRGRIYVNPYGDVYPCNFWPAKCYGNLVTDDFRSIIQEMRKDIPDRPKQCRASNIDADAIQRLNERIAADPLDIAHILD